MLPRDLKLLIRANAGPRIGAGHLMRGIAIGQAWKSIGGQVAFACGNLPGVLKNKIHREGFTLYSMAHGAGDGTDARETSEIATSFEPDWIVLDGYEFDDAYQSHLRLSGEHLMVIDDFGHGRHEKANLVLNQNAFASQHNYRHLAADRLLLGTKYLLLRNEFSAEQLQTMGNRFATTARRVLVTFGGGDHENITLRVLKSLDSMTPLDLVVDAVIGASYQHIQELKEFKKSTRLNLRIHRNVDRMSSLMSNVDLAITAGGSTCYELARCGIPAVIIPIADNQQPVAAELAGKGIAVSCGDRENFEGEQLVNSVREILENPDVRRSMSEKGKKLVDGKGASRIVRRMASRLYDLRDATCNDAKLLLDLRNEPEFRAMSFNPQAVSPQANRNWLNKQIHAANSILWIAHCKKHDSPLGFISVELDDKGSTAILNICLHLSERAKGHGPVLIEKASRFVFSQFEVSRIIVQIKKGTPGSQMAFLKAGYQPLAPTVVNGHTALQMMLAPKMIDDAASSSHPRLKSA